MSNSELYKPKEVFFENTGKDSGKFIIVPLEAGYGITLGNAYRRVLLSSLYGYAITSVKIPGVKHEYSTIPGVSQDLVDICLNLKQIRFKKKIDDPIEQDKICVALRKKSVFKAGDIADFTSSFQILNPELVICNFSPNTNMDIELTIQKGKGYVPANEINVGSSEIGILALDAIFSPIKNVRFDIENTRVGTKTDYDKLTIEILTDGTISPEDALETASRILIESFSVMLRGGLTDVEKSLLDNDIVTNAELSMRKLLKKPIKEFTEDLSTRSINCLEGANILTLGHLIEKSSDDIKNIKSFGTKSFKEVQAIVEKYQLSLPPKSKRG